MDAPAGLTMNRYIPCDVASSYSQIWCLNTFQAGNVI